VSWKNINKIVRGFGYVFLVSTLLFACQQGEQSVEDKKEQLRNLKQQKQDLEEQISKLEKAIQGADTTQAGSEARYTKVNTQTLAARPFHHFIEVHGNVEAKQNLRISPEINGRIEKIHVEEGERVQKNELLVSLDKSLIRKNIEEVETSLDHARTVYQRQKNLWEQEIGSEIKYLEAKNNKERLERKLSTLQTQLDKADIKAPVSGTVDKIHFEEGEMTAPAQPLLQLVNFDKLFVEAEVSEAHLGKVEVGDTVKVAFPALNKEQKERVIHVGQVINPNSRTFTVKVELTDRTDLLKPNVMALIKINDRSIDSALVIPSHIVQEDAEGEYIYTIDADADPPVARQTRVVTGLHYGGKTVVEKGLQSGQQVVVDGFNELKAGRHVAVHNNRYQERSSADQKAANQGASSESQAADPAAVNSQGKAH
jgi:RND family efflux transporter MFP subunit